MREVLKIVLSLSLSGSLLALLLLLCKPLYRNRLHRTWQYYVWMIVVVRLLLPFAPATNLIGTVLQSTQTPPAATAAEAIETAPDLDVVVEIPDAPAAAGNATSATASPTLWEELRPNLWLLWLGVAALLLVRKITSYHSFTRFIRAGCKEIDDPDLLDTYFGVSEAMGIRRKLPIYHNELAVSPLMTGILRPAIVLPDITLTGTELEMVLRHELTHYRRGDILYKWLVQIATCIHWFNPLVALACREINKNCELACDETVLREMDDDAKVRYGDTLLATIKTGGGYGDTVVSVTLSEDGRLLKERLEAILRYGRKPKVVAACSVALSMLLLCGAAFTGAYTGARSVHPPQVQPTAASETAAQITEISTIESDSLQEDSAQAALAQTESWGANWTDSFKDSWANLWDGLASSGIQMQQSSYFRDGYFLTLRWKSGDDIDLYSHSTSIRCGNKHFVLAFAQDTAAYAEDTNLILAAQAEITELVQQDNVRNWDDSFFVLLRAAGPYSESPDELLKTAYAEHNDEHFLPLLPKAGTEVKLQLLEQAYSDGRDSALMFLLDELPAGTNVDALAERAVRDNNEEMAMWLLDFASADKKRELATLYSGDSIVGANLLDEVMGDLSQSEVDELLRASYADKDLHVFIMMLDEASTAACEELLPKAYDELRLDYFAQLVDYLPAQSAVYGTLAVQAYNDDRVEYFSLIADYVPNATMMGLAKRAFSKQNYAFQPFLMDYVTQ